MATNQHWIAALALGAFSLWTPPAHAQRGGADWTTGGSDAQRLSWLRSDPKISTANLQKPGFDLIWKVQVDADRKQAFLPPVLLDRYIGYRGFRSLGLVGVTGDRIVGIDTDLARIEWRQQLPSGASACGSAAAAFTRPTSAAFPANPTGPVSFMRRGGPAKSAVGEATQGAVTIQQASATRGGGGRAAAGRGAAGRGAPNAPPRGFTRMPAVLHVVTRDGKLHTVYVSNGEPHEPAMQFVPANSTVKGFVVVDNVAYAAVGQGCDAAPDTVVALDLESKQVSTYHVPAGAVSGEFGPAVGPDGTVYAATTGGDLVALDARTLKQKDVYHTGGAFASSPVLFEYKDKAMIAASTQDGRIHLLDAGAVHTPIYQSTAVGPVVSTLASWQDAGGTRWLLGATSGAIVSWKVAERNGSPSLETGWTSRGLASPLAPIIVDGVAFTASTGSAPTLYALDASTGKELWNSGRKIPAAVRGGGLSAGNTQVYLGADDGMLYVFGFPIEH